MMEDNSYKWWLEDNIACNNFSNDEHFSDIKATVTQEK